MQFYNILSNGNREILSLKSYYCAAKSVGIQHSAGGLFNAKIEYN